MLVATLAGCGQAPNGPSAYPDPADQVFVNDVSIVKRHGRVMSWEQQQLDRYFSDLARRPAIRLSCKERELSLVQPAIDNLIDHADTVQRRGYDDQARRQLQLILKGGNPCDFPPVHLD